MKRSEINNYIEKAIEFFNENNFKLPKWAYYLPEDWKNLTNDYTEIKQNMLGWDVTDFGGNNFKKKGLLLFTLRNGNIINSGIQKTYAEKIMLVREKQVTPTHFHWKKMEDIINRAGGVLCIQLWKADKNEKLSKENFSVKIDGITKNISSGDIVRLSPGESICLEPFVYHSFWAEDGLTIIGEVSQVNDDNTDNRFYEFQGRFPTIEEDEKPLHFLCNEYI